MISACVMLLVAGTGLGCEVAIQQFSGLAKKAFQTRDLCILAHDMDLKGGYIIYTLQGSD